MEPRCLLGARRAFALALLVALGVGAVGVHEGDPGHGPAPDGPVFACDLDHGRATHVEAARAVEPHDCAVCLHRLHNRGGAERPVVAAGLAAGDDAPPASIPAPPPFPPLAAAPSRGPPLA